MTLVEMARHPHTEPEQLPYGLFGAIHMKWKMR
jgi:hypothetical protein